MDTNSAHDTARILIEALPYIQRFSGTTRHHGRYQIWRQCHGERGAEEQLRP